MIDRYGPHDPGGGCVTNVIVDAKLRDLLKKEKVILREMAAVLEEGGHTYVTLHDSVKLRLSVIQAELHNLGET
jgi:hypothetical protein